ncbi:MAG: NAD-binding protein [Actinobacteria bacterium]|nr:NAD-binding protein [Actinomycetota bacterium]
MGRQLAEVLNSAGHRIVLCDAHSAAQHDDIERGIGWAATPADCASGQDAVFIFVRTSEQVEDVVLADVDGVLMARVRPSVVILGSTVSLITTERIDTACREAGVAFIDAPVNGRPPDLVIFAGTRRRDLVRFGPLLDEVSRAVHHVGPAGCGTITKHIHQLVLYANHLNSVVALQLGVRAGIDERTLLRALLDSGAASRALSGLADRTGVARLPDGASIDLIAKDMLLVEQTAEMFGERWPVVAGLLQIYRAAQVAGLGSEHFDRIREVTEQ